MITHKIKELAPQNIIKLRKMILEYKVKIAKNYNDLDCIYNPNLDFSALNKESMKNADESPVK